MIYMITGETQKKGGSRETKEHKGTEGGRTGYGKRAIVTPVSPYCAVILRYSFALRSRFCYQ